MCNKQRSAKGLQEKLNFWGALRAYKTHLLSRQLTQHSAMDHRARPRNTVE